MNELDKMERISKRLVSGLDQGCQQLDGDIAERLRFMRERAIDHANFEGRSVKPLVTGPEVVLAGAGTGSAGPSQQSHAWKWFLLGGMVMIALMTLFYRDHTNSKPNSKSSVAKVLPVAAEYDVQFDAETAELITSEVPPQAYTDQGFAHYVKLTQDN